MSEIISCHLGEVAFAGVSADTAVAVGVDETGIDLRSSEIHALAEQGSADLYDLTAFCSDVANLSVQTYILYNLHFVLQMRLLLDRFLLTQQL